jgi:hypothetical protein
MVIYNYVGVQQLTINDPKFGYDSEIHMPIITSKIHPRGYAFKDIDPLGSLDYRMLSNFSTQLPVDQKTSLNTILRTTLRCEKFVLHLGSTPTGFYPFGPDLGDVGDFCVKINTREQRGMTIAPWKYFEDNISFVFCPDATWPAPNPSMPFPRSQGTFGIGNVGACMLQPQDVFKVDTGYNFTETALSRSGVPSNIDGTTANDFWETSFAQQCNQSIAANLMDFLQDGANGGRTAAMSIGGSGCYPYGVDIGDGYTTSNFLGSSNTGREIIIKCKHEGINRFTFPLSFCKVN